jgi:AmmeMemoRadiSam system protein A
VAEIDARVLRLPEGVGVAGVRLARSHLVRHLGRARDPEEADAPVAPQPTGLESRRGVFVTLLRGADLAGCVGYVEPVAPLSLLIPRAAEAAARDPRLPPVFAEDLPLIRFEVSFLSPPVPVGAHSSARLLDAVRIGEHGVVVHGPGSRRGLLLPQVAVEHGFTVDQFLSACCEKAGLPSNAWASPTLPLRWFTFGAQCFEELAPAGPIRERGLSSAEADTGIA